MRTSTWGTTTWTPWSRTPTPIMELIDCDTFYICRSRIQPKRNCYKLSTIWGVAFFVCVCNTTCVPLCYHVSHGGDKKLIVAPSDEIMARVFECFILASQLLQAKGKLVFLNFHLCCGHPWFHDTQVTANATTICTRTQSLTLGLLKLTMQWVNAIGEQFSHGTAESMGNGDTFLHQSGFCFIQVLCGRFKHL